MFLMVMFLFLWLFLVFVSVWTYRSIRVYRWAKQVNEVFKEEARRVKAESLSTPGGWAQYNRRWVDLKKPQ